MGVLIYHPLNQTQLEAIPDQALALAPTVDPAPALALALIRVLALALALSNIEAAKTRRLGVLGAATRALMRAPDALTVLILSPALLQPPVG